MWRISQSLDLTFWNQRHQNRGTYSDFSKFQKHLAFLFPAIDDYYLQLSCDGNVCSAHTKNKQFFGENFWEIINFD